jgi:hypothetical protein
MARGVFAQFSKTAETALRYRYVCEACGETSDWFTARMSHTFLRTQRIGRFNVANKLIESTKQIEADQTAVNNELSQAIKKFNAAITQRTTEVIFPGDPFLSDAYNDIFAHGNECPFCGERQTWYPAVSETPSILKSIRNKAIIFALVSLIPTYLTTFYFTPLISAVLGTAIGFLTAKSQIRDKQKFFDSHPKHNNPEIEWNYVPEDEESTDSEQLSEDAEIHPLVDAETQSPALTDTATAAKSLAEDALADTPAVAESLAEDALTTPAVPLTETQSHALSAKSPQSIIAEIISNDPLTTNPEPAIITVKTNKTDIYKQLKGKEHINILTIHQVTDGNITFEDFNGITLQERLKSPLSVHDFEDYFTQICDALEFLHSQKKPISYNNLTADNIVIGDDNLLKLFNFNKADNVTPISQDIEAVARLMLIVNEKYVKRYTSITKPCFSGKFTNFDEINMAISKNVRNRLGIRYSLLAAGLMMLFMFRRVGSRLVPMFEQLFHEVWKMVFGT